MKKLIVILNKIQNKYEDVQYLCGVFVWMFKQSVNPRPIGTVFFKTRGKEKIYYEVVDHIPGIFKREVIKKINKQVK